jgi:hypothetical protein
MSNTTTPTTTTTNETVKVITPIHFYKGFDFAVGKPANTFDPKFLNPLTCGLVTACTDRFRVFTTKDVFDCDFFSNQSGGVDINKIIPTEFISSFWVNFEHKHIKAIKAMIELAKSYNLNLNTSYITTDQDKMTIKICDDLESSTMQATLTMDIVTYCPDVYTYKVNLLYIYEFLNFLFKNKFTTQSIEFKTNGPKPLVLEAFDFIYMISLLK